MVAPSRCPRHILEVEEVPVLGVVEVVEEEAMAAEAMEEVATEVAVGTVVEEEVAMVATAVEEVMVVAEVTLLYFYFLTF